jgi:hypothetical protein
LTALSFVITPYTRAHDELVLATCWAAVLAAAAVSSGRKRTGLVVGAVTVSLLLPWLLTGLSRVGLPLAWYVIIPLATAALAVHSIRVHARARATRVG